MGIILNHITLHRNALFFRINAQNLSKNAKLLFQDRKNSLQQNHLNYFKTIRIVLLLNNCIFSQIIIKANRGNEIIRLLIGSWVTFKYIVQ